jgi:hypothetical protein
MAEIHFRSREASQNKGDVSIQFLVGDFVFHFARIFHLSGSVQKLFKNFMLVQWLKIFFHFLGANMTPKIFFGNLDTDTPKGTLLRKSASIARHYGPGGCCRSGCRVPEE